MFHKGRFIAVLCLAAVLLAALTPASGLVCGVLVRALPLRGAVIAVPVAEPAPASVLPFLFVRAGGSRAPPLG